MNHSGVERRRVSRVPLEHAYEVAVVTSTPVQLADISQLGGQLISKLAVSGGERGELSTVIRSRTMRLPVEVRHVAVEHGRRGPRYRAGVSFGPMTVEHRMMLKEILGAEPT
jgi:hypothetical protein